MKRYLAAAAALPHFLQIQRRSAEWPIERIANHSRLPRKIILAGVSGLAETESGINKSRKEYADIGCAAQIRFVNATHRGRGSERQQWPNPLALGSAQARRAERL